MKVSLCVHSYNEADALRLLIRSSFPVADMVAEWVVVDHRSDDHTGEVMREMEEELGARGVQLRFKREERGLSRAFTFADVRNLTLGMCTRPAVVLMDADFILTDSFRPTVSEALRVLSPRRSRYWGAGCNIPCVWDKLETDAGGVITDHGRVWVHSRRPRVLMREHMTTRQDKNGGKWEGFYPTSRYRHRQYQLTRHRPHLPRERVAFVACNVKPAERLALRDTMTYFMEDVMQGKIDGEWVEQYEAGNLRAQGEYDFQEGVDLKGWKLHAPGLSLP